MDAITQGLLGAAAAQALLSHRLGRRTWLYGALGGMAADLDVLIRSGGDPTLAIEYHRHFTHSLVFIPIGGLLVALPWLLQRRRPASERRAIALATTAGYATHALLDAFTSYGTMLWWPFSDARVAWSWISIIDLAYSLPLLVGVIWAARQGRARAARIALLVASGYMVFCGLQRARVLHAQEALIAHRGHDADRRAAFPSLGNNVTWRSLYAADGVVYADKIRAPWTAATRVIEGDRIPLLGADADAEYASDPATARALALFRWFSSGWVARDRDNPRRIGDLRYALRPGDVATMWGLTLEPGGDPPVIWDRAGARGVALAEAWRVLFEDNGQALALTTAGPEE